RTRRGRRARRPERGDVPRRDPRARRPGHPARGAWPAHGRRYRGGSGMSEGHDAQPEYLASSPDKEPAERTEVAEEAATQARLDARNRAQATDQAAGTEPAAAQPSTFAARFLRALWSANTVTVTVLAIALAMVLGAILIIVSDANVRRTYSYFFTRPSDALTASWNKAADAYANLFKGAIVDPEALAGAFNGTVRWERVFYPISETLSYTAPLAFTGLAFAVAFRGGLFNIGVQGQAIRSEERRVGQGVGARWA